MLTKIALLCLDSVVAPKGSCDQKADDEELGADHGEARGTVRRVGSVTAFM